MRRFPFGIHVDENSIDLAAGVDGMSKSSLLTFPVIKILITPHI